MSASIAGIGVALPELVVTNEQLAAENPSWDMATVRDRAGVGARRIAAPGETAHDLSIRACERLFEENGVVPAAFDALLVCTQSPDYPMPGNAHLLHEHFGMSDRMLAFDFTLACSGYVYGLALADSLVRSGTASEILFVTADTYSKRINPRDRSARVLFGDGAAATHVLGAPGDLEIVAAELRTQGRDYEKFYVPAGGMRRPQSQDTAAEVTDRHGNVRSAENIQMDGMGVWAFLNSVVPDHIRSFLEANSLTTDDIDLYVFHQASKLTLDSLAKALSLPSEKVYLYLEDVGNLVSASIPVALKAAHDDGSLPRGGNVLLCGFGVGFSYGSVLLRV